MKVSEIKTKIIENLKLKNCEAFLLIKMQHGNFERTTEN